MGHTSEMPGYFTATQGNTVLKKQKPKSGRICGECVCKSIHSHPGPSSQTSLQVTKHSTKVTAASLTVHAYGRKAAGVEDTV